MRWRIAMVCAASCGGGTGALLSITPPAGTDHVELLVAPSTCDANGGDCAAGISWASDIAPTRGTIFSLGSDERTLISVPRAGTFTLKLEAPDVHETNPDRLALVAFDNQDVAIGIGVLRDPVISTTEASSLDITLDPIVELDPTNPGTSGAHVWRPPAVGAAVEDSGYASCVATANPDGVEFYVPSDHDCDNETPECNEFWYQSTATTLTSCFTNTSPTLGACVLGTSKCSDGTPSTCSFTASPNNPELCVPDAVCQCSDPFSALGCLREVMQDGYRGSSATMTYADCDFQSDGANLCAASSGDASLYLPRDCTAVALYKATIPLSTTPLAISTGAPATAAPFGSGQPGLTIALGSMTPCAIRLSWDTTGVMSAKNPIPPFLVLDVTLTSSAHMVLPLHFNFPADCSVTTQPICSLAGNGSGDHLFQCGD